MKYYFFQKKRTTEGGIKFMYRYQEFIIIQRWGDMAGGLSPDELKWIDNWLII